MAEEKGSGGKGRGQRFSLLLRPFGNVRRSEVATAGVLSLIVFLLLTAYYVLKVVREPLIMLGGGAEVKRFAAAGHALLLLLAVRGYDTIAARFDRMRLITAINLFFILNLVVFFLLGTRGVPLGIPFFLWVGIFNVTLLAQFWAFANDLYTEEQGGRLFGVVGIGSSLGAVLGAFLAGALFARLGPYLLMLVAALLLILCLAMMLFVNRREVDRTPAQSRRAAFEPLGSGNAFRLLLQDRYLMLVALLTLLFNTVNSTGDYLLDRKLLDHVATLGGGSQAASEYIGGFRASFFSWVNVASLLLQSFVVSRVMQRYGTRVTLLVTPLFALGGYGTIALLPILPVITVARAAEDSLAYSFQTTGLQGLFLVTSREAKYRAKTAVDTFFWRSGDLVAAGLVLLGSALALNVVAFAWINFGLVVVWLSVMLGLGRLHRERSEVAAAQAA